MRAVLAVAVLAAGCAELGSITDGTSISVGKPNDGYLVAGARIPDQGDGFLTRDVWVKRGNRYGTDELVELVEAVARRMAKQVKDVRLVVADLSSRSGGGAWAFHRSHQSGRDADLLYYMRDREGQPFEPDAMHQFDGRGRARDGSGLTVDIPRTWLLVKDLLTAPEATVQYIFMYEPLTQKLLDHAKQIGEPEQLIAQARKALRQPGDSARHDDHMHVRVYCAPNDREYGCIDIGPMDLLAEREAEQAAQLDQIAAALPRAPAAVPLPAAMDQWFGDGNATVSASSAATSVFGSVGQSLLRAGPDRIDLRGWR